MAKLGATAGNLIIIFPVPISDSNWILEGWGGEDFGETIIFCLPSCVTERRKILKEKMHHFDSWNA
jgi:hypothetical protein